MSTQTIKIKTNEEDPESVELIAESIIQVSAAFEKINKSRLSRKAIILLLQNYIGVNYISKKQIGYVLEYAPKLKDYFLKKV